MPDSPPFDLALDLAHLRAHLTPVPRPAFQGQWATIELQPDPFVRQRFTIGVVVAAEQGGFDFRLVPHLRRLRRWYSRSQLARAHHELEAARQRLAQLQRAGAEIQSAGLGLDAVSLGGFWFTSGSSQTAVLERLFAEEAVVGH